MSFSNCGYRLLRYINNKIYNNKYHVKSLYKPKYLYRFGVMSSGVGIMKHSYSSSSSSSLNNNNDNNNKDVLKLALCQMEVGDNKKLNLENAEKYIKNCVDNGAEMVVLPEMFNCPYSNASFPPFSEEIPSIEDKIEHLNLSNTTGFICRMAKKYNVWLVAGSIPEKVLNNDNNEIKYYNTCLVANSNGELIAKHRKVHLFDIDVPGGISFHESDTLSPGNKFTMFESPWGPIGIGICYDIRFAEYAQILANNGCKLLIYPGAFNMTTGPAHWELLSKARALDNQLYVATCAPARDLNASYHSFGHSMIVSPWGDKLAYTDEKPNIVLAQVDFNRVNEVRTSIPIRNQKRHDMYEVMNKSS